MESQFERLGNVIAHTPAGVLLGGAVVQIAGGKAGIAQHDIAAGVADWLKTAGIFKVQFVGGPTDYGNPGDPVYWDDNGTPYGGSATGAATTVAADGDYLIGSLVAAAIPTDTVCYVDLNVYADDPRTFLGKVHEIVSATKTLDVQDVGKVIHVDTDAFTITLPSTVIGYEYIIVNDGVNAGVLIDIAVAAADKIMGPDIAGTDTKGQQNTKTTAIRGDYIILRGDGVAGWYIMGKRGTWTEAA